MKECYVFSNDKTLCSGCGSCAISCRHNALKMIEDSMKQETKVFRNKRNSTDDMLEAAEYCANLLEASEMVPMCDPPTARIKAWRAQKESERDVQAIRKFTYELGQTLKEKCQIY